jgi:hypothetical protein
MRLIIDIDLDSPALVIPDEGRLDMARVEAGIFPALRELARLAESEASSFESEIRDPGGRAIGTARVVTERGEAC